MTNAIMITLHDIESTLSKIVKSKLEVAVERIGDRKETEKEFSSDETVRSSNFMRKEGASL